MSHARASTPSGLSPAANAPLSATTLADHFVAVEVHFTRVVKLPETPDRFGGNCANVPVISTVAARAHDTVPATVATPDLFPTEPSSRTVTLSCNGVGFSTRIRPKRGAEPPLQYCSNVPW